MAEITRVKAEYRSSIRSKVMIREALLALLLEKPFDKVSITDIVRKADINRGTFYAHFANTSEVLTSISESIVDEMAGIFKGVDSLSVLYDPKSSLEQITAFLLKDLDFVRKLLCIDKFSGVLENCRKSIVRKVMEDLGDEFSLEEKRRIEATLDFAISGIGNLYIDIILGQVDIPFEESADYVAGVIKPMTDSAIAFLNSKATR